MDENNEYFKIYWVPLPEVMSWYTWPYFSRTVDKFTSIFQERLTFTSNSSLAKKIHCYLMG